MHLTPRDAFQRAKSGSLPRDGGITAIGACGLVASLLNRSGSELSKIQAPTAQSEKQEPSVHENLKRKIV